MKTISTESYSLEIPDEWESQINLGGTVSILNPHGVGAITISSYTAQKESSDGVGALKKFVKGRGSVQRKSLNEFDIAESEYVDLLQADSPVYVYVMTIHSHHQLLLISYNCKKSNFSKEELATVRDIIATLKFDV